MSNLQPHFSFPSTVSVALLHTASTQIEQRRSNFFLRVFGAVVFKFEPNLTVVTLVQKFVKCCSNQECCSICVDTVDGKDSTKYVLKTFSSFNSRRKYPTFYGAERRMGTY